MLYQFPRKYATVNSRKKYYAEYVVRGWVGRVKPHCSSVLIMKGRERGREGERGGITGIHIMYVHTIHTHTHKPSQPIIMHGHMYYARDENATAYVCIACHDLLRT